MLTPLRNGRRSREILRIKKVLNEILVTHTGQDIKKIEKDTDRDFFLSAKEAVKYGLVDEIIEHSDLGKKKKK